MRKVVMVVAAVAVALAVPVAAHAGGGAQDAGKCPGFAEGTTVEMLDGCFDGVAHFSPGPGAILTVENAGDAPHTYTAVDRSFDTGIVEAGESVELPEIAPGVYRVFCTLHGTTRGEGMAGVLIVGDLAAAKSGTVPIAPPPNSADGELLAAINRQTEVLSAIGDRQTDLLNGLQPAGDGPPDWAWQVTILLGLGAGAAVVALSVARRSARPAPTQVVGEIG